MCGICGTIGLLDKDSREPVVRKMNLAIRHRGPDQDGFFSDETATLAMSRLSVIDLSSGKQPIFNEDNSILIFFNGEIYNYRELKTILEDKGHVFKTHSDTEVILHLYEEEGENTPKYLKGMFAFCIYELQTKKFFFARDRFGEKPFFYFFSNKGLAFSSEIKSLLENAQIPRILNKGVLHYYLNASYVPEPETLLENVKTLPPGHFLTYQNNEVYVKKYFTFDYKPDYSLNSEEKVIDFLNPFLDQAVKRQMVSDVPLGAFLSGGIDSSTVVAKLQKNSSRKIKTFNVKFEESTYDESPIAREVAEYLGTDHHELVIPNTNFSEDIFWTIIDHVALPFPDSSAIPSFLITKEIRKHVTVALSGDGGDELFGGYSLFNWYLKLSKLQSFPFILRKFGIGCIGALKGMPLLNSVSQLRQLYKALSISLKQETEIPVYLHSLFSEDSLKEILHTEQLDFSLLKTYPDQFKHWTSLRKIMYYRLIHNLPLDMLIKVDRMSMANSLEVRAPFLDPDLFEASTKIPDQYLIHNGTGKYIIRKVMEKELPSSVFNHPKTGFSIPLHKYQNEQFGALAENLLFSDVRFTEFFGKEFLKKIIEEGIRNQKSNSSVSVYQSSHRLWSLMQLSGWMKRFNINF